MAKEPIWRCNIYSCKQVWKTKLTFGQFRSVYSIVHMFINRMTPSYRVDDCKAIENEEFLVNSEVSLGTMNIWRKS